MSSRLARSCAAARLAGFGAVAALLLMTRGAVPVQAGVYPPPIIDPIANQTVAEGATLDVAVHAVNPNPWPYDSVVLSVNYKMPSFATLTSYLGDGTLHIAPGYGDAGTYSDVQLVAHGTDSEAIAAFTITVTHANRPPVLDSIANQTVAEGAPLDVQLAASDPDGDPLAFSGTLPPFATLTDHHDGTAAVRIAPGYSDAGTYSGVTIVVSDGNGGADSKSFRIDVTNSDVTTPVVTVPDEVRVEATGPTGAMVTDSASATDDKDGSIAPTCVPPSGNRFALGHTTVTCSVADSAGNVGRASFTVTVVDTAAPAVTAPGGGSLADVTVTATSAAGARVAFTVGANDIVDGTLTPVCTPASGSLFAVGTTQVTCTAADESGNAGSATFHVTVTANPVPNPTTPPTSTTGLSEPTTRHPDLLVIAAAATASLLAVAYLVRRRRHITNCPRPGLP
jgi:hypothetical protein